MLLLWAAKQNSLHLQVDSSRYGLEDFDEIARILAHPLTEFGIPQTMLLPLWSAAAQFVSKDPSGRTEYFTYAMVHFIPGLSPESAATIQKKLEAGATDEVLLAFHLLLYCSRSMACS
jgi:hypothetical protein